MMVSAGVLREIASRNDGVNASRMRWFASILQEGKAECWHHPKLEDVLLFRISGSSRSPQSAPIEISAETGAHLPMKSASRKATREMSLREDGPAFLFQRRLRDAEEALSSQVGYQYRLDV